VKQFFVGLMIFLIGLNVFFLITEPSITSVLTIFAALFVIFLWTEDPHEKPKSLNSINERMREVRKQLDSHLVLRGNFYEHSFAYREHFYDLEVEYCQLNMAWLRAHKYGRSFRETVMRKITRSTFPDIKLYTESRAFWLDQTNAWRKMRDIVLDQNF